eukprot:m.298816 g.298816  ORF g.298816 m.298816 type:complete len:89 (+) comp27223_c0_seq24:116-382(+)
MGWTVCAEGGDGGCLGNAALLPRDEDPGWKTQYTTKTRKQQIEESEVEYSRRKDFWAYNEPAEVRAKGMWMQEIYCSVHVAKWTVVRL